MVNHENLRATGEARSSIGKSAAPVSRHDMAMRRYLAAIDHTSHDEHAGRAEPAAWARTRGHIRCSARSTR